MSADGRPNSTTPIRSPTCASRAQSLANPGTSCSTKSTLSSRAIYHTVLKYVLPPGLLYRRDTGQSSHDLLASSWYRGKRQYSICFFHEALTPNQELAHEPEEGMKQIHLKEEGACLSCQN